MRNEKAKRGDNDLDLENDYSIQDADTEETLVDWR